jgi:hypothetical protein
MRQIWHDLELRFYLINETFPVRTTSGCGSKKQTNETKTDMKASVQQTPFDKLSLLTRLFNFLTQILDGQKRGRI